MNRKNLNFLLVFILKCFNNRTICILFQAGKVFVLWDSSPNPHKFYCGFYTHQNWGIWGCHNPLSLLPFPPYLVMVMIMVLTLSGYWLWCIVDRVGERQAKRIDKKIVKTQLSWDPIENFPPSSKHWRQNLVLWVRTGQSYVENQ